MALLGTLDPRQQQEEQRRVRSAQELHQAEDLAKLLMEHGQTQEHAFTSPWQAAGQIAQTLAGKNRMASLAGAYPEANLTAAGGPVPQAPGAPDAAPAGGSSSFKFSPEVEKAIAEGSQAAGVNPQMMARFARIESGGRSGPESDTGSYKGLMQVSPQEMAEVSGGKGNVHNAKDSTMAAGLIAKRNAAAYEKFTGRQPEPFDLYMMHQQGPAGYLQHVGNPDAPAWQNMANTGEGKIRGEHWAQQAITGNGGHIGDTSGQFIDRWRQKWSHYDNGDHAAIDAHGQPAQPYQVAGPPTAAPGAPTAAAPPQGGAPSPSPAPPGAAPGGNPAGGPPSFIPPTAKMPMNADQVNAALRFGGPNAMAIREQYLGYMKPETVTTPDGHTYTGNPYIGYTLSQMPAKPTIEKMQMETGGVPGMPKEAPAQLVPNAGGGFHYKTIPIEGAPGGGGLGGGTMEERAAKGYDILAAGKGKEEEAKSQAQARTKQFSGVYAGITGAGDNAAHQAQNIQQLREIAPSAFTGSGSDAILGLNRLASRLGIDPKGAAPRELFNTLAARVLADQFSGMRNLAAEEGSPASRVFKSMLDIEEKANITHEDSLDGVLAKLNTLEQAGKQAMHWADMADDHVAKHGSLDASFMKKLRKDIAESKFENVIPKEEKGKAEPAAPAMAAPAAAAPMPSAGKRLKYNPATGRIE